MTRSARSAWNYATVLAFSAVTMLVSLVATPSLLSHLGEARLGAARAVTDCTGYLSLLELGLGGALAPLLARELAREDGAGVGGMMAAGFRAYLRVTLAMLAGGFILAVIITRLIRIDPALHHDLRIAALVGITPLLLMPLSPLRSLAEASQRGYVVNLFLIAQSVVITSCAVIFAVAGLGITGQILALAVGAFLLAALLVTDALTHARRLLPSHLNKAPEECSRQLWRLNTPTLILNACGRVGLLTDNIIIGSILNAGAIVPFLMTQRLGQLAQSQLQSIGSATWAGLAELHARGEHELFRLRFLELTRLVTMAGLTVLIPILAYNHVFVRLWVGESRFAGVTLTTLAVANAMILSLASLWGWVFSGTGQMARLVPMSIASAALNLVVSLGMTVWLSHHNAHRALWGPVLGTTSAYMLVNMPLLPLLLRKHFAVPIRGMVAAVAIPVVVSVPYAAVVAWIAVHFPPPGWLALAGHMSASAIVFCAICWRLLFSSDERRTWKKRMRLIVGVPPTIRPA